MLLAILYAYLKRSVASIIVLSERHTTLDGGFDDRNVEGICTMTAGYVAEGDH